eukprot:CAMPEP_0197035466 /NCGR_PEP_ID=MMETSP1384-20130603/13259_1 /TAXON_ID=29189 /ORGANISM="Ammonia sp." /LENGTH=163 /DNA_ID=CAMNT_0042465535 /DNA_START=44 /DNA_END=535 /DNA_ORIENTATION=+
MASNNDSTSIDLAAVAPAEKDMKRTPFAPMARDFDLRYSIPMAPSYSPDMSTSTSVATPFVPSWMDCPLCRSMAAEQAVCGADSPEPMESPSCACDFDIDFDDMCAYPLCDILPASPPPLPELDNVYTYHDVDTVITELDIMRLVQSVMDASIAITNAAKQRE